MPRGDNPNSRANLIKNSDLTPKQRREKASMMGKRSGEVKRALKTFKELDDEFTTDAERKKMLAMLKKRAEQGNLKAFELYRDTMGMKPIDKINVSQVDQGSVDEMREAMKRRSDAIHEERSNGDLT